MCSNKSSPVGQVKERRRTSKRIRKRRHMESKTTMDKSSSRKIRTKTKRLKFLCLKLQINNSQDINETHKSKKNKKNNKHSKTQGANTTLCAEKKRPETTTTTMAEDEQYDTVAAYLFSSATDSTIYSIHDLLPSSAAAAAADVNFVEAGRNNLSPYDRQEHGSSSSSLLRTAMRKGASEEEEETTEERWVIYSEVVEEVMSGSGTPRSCDGRPSLTLKLDYDHIMEAWSDKGTLYIDGEPPQTVPDLHASTDGYTEGGEAGSLWAVPEMDTTERLWRGHREASLLRYKEKRQNRLFSKRIRYEVRKLNAEKRPRIKGRFVKRDD